MKPRDFRQAFLETWRERTKDAESREVTATAYEKDSTWTKFMLGEKNTEGFLHDVAGNLKRHVYREYYTLDCVYYTDEFNNFEGGGYPVGFDVIIEHENGNRPEEEWWKMLMWRAPLKVLICYDYTDQSKRTNPARENWLVGKLETFAEMKRQASEGWQGRKDEDEYLILVGYLPPGEKLPHWRWL